MSSRSSLNQDEVPNPQWVLGRAMLAYENSPMLLSKVEDTTAFRPIDVAFCIQ